MNLFDVYPLLDIEPIRGKGVFIWDKKNDKYLDLYGGHAVISIGHCHPHYNKAISEQMDKLGFYSNYVKNSLQKKLALKLGEICGYNDYNLFLCNSGAEANENALKVASFYNGRKKIISFSNGFHGRTSLAAASTDGKNIVAPVNETENIIRLPFNDEEVLEKAFSNEVSAVIVEGIQGVAGVYLPTDSFLKKIEQLCKEHGAVFIVDEIQSGYGRTGKFFAHQYCDVNPDIITVAKGIANGFPLAGVLLSPKFIGKHGMLGTTYGGNHLSCSAGLAVLEILENENLIENARKVGQFLIERLSKVSGVVEVRGKGLMIGVEFESTSDAIRGRLLSQCKIITGSSSNKNTLRILPPLTLNLLEAEMVIEGIENCLK